jgi:prephenate dehydrogenase
MPVDRLAIVGTGLIGASVGLAARRAGVKRVAGWDPDADALATAVERGAVTVASSSLADALADADLAVVAAPVSALPAQVAATLEASDATCTVTDVGSTKAAVCAAVPDRVRFIGGHPIAGAETRGPEHASAELFVGATWFLTPVPETQPERYRTVAAFVRALGAVPRAIEPRTHDRLLALTSHLPHALANLMLNQAGAARVDGHEALTGAGGSLRDMTRVAGANPRLWVDVFIENADELLVALGDHRRRIEELERALTARDAGYVGRWIGEAAGHRRRLLQIQYGAEPGALYRVVVHVPDRPGVFAAITQALAAERINLEDFEMHHVTPEQGGQLELLVVGEDAARRAAELLEQQGYAVILGQVLEADG